MLAIRIIVEVIIFIYIMSLSIRIRKQKIKKTQRIKMIRIFLTIMFLVVVPYSACIPVENFFITFKTPDDTLSFLFLVPMRFHRSYHSIIPKSEVRDSFHEYVPTRAR